MVGSQHARLASPLDVPDTAEGNEGRKIFSSVRAISKYMKQAACLALICSISLIVDLNSVQAFDAKQEGWIEGIGYREQELQVAKGTVFASEDANGIPYASFGGGTNIFIKGVEFADNAQSNLVIFDCTETFTKGAIGPKLTEDDAF